jgi:hypothetical protein
VANIHQAGSASTVGDKGSGLTFRENGRQWMDGYYRSGGYLFGSYECCFKVRHNDLSLSYHCLSFHVFLNKKGSH